MNKIKKNLTVSSAVSKMCVPDLFNRAGEAGGVLQKHLSIIHSFILHQPFSSNL